MEFTESEKNKYKNNQSLIQEDQDNSLIFISNNSEKTVITETANVGKYIAHQLVKHIEDCNNILNCNNDSTELSETNNILQFEKNKVESDNGTFLSDTNNSIAISEDKSTKWNLNEDFIVPDIFSLLHIWHDDNPESLKSINHMIFIMKNLLCEHLPIFNVKETIPNSPECLLILLQDCLSQYKRTMNTFKSRVIELELELEENRKSSVQRYDLIVEEHKERLSLALELQS